MDVILRLKEEKRIQRGHLWVFSNEIARVVGEPGPGTVVRVLRHDGIFLGSGFYHPHSLIAVRLLSSSEIQPDEGFFRSRLEEALALRRSVYPDQQAFRLAHGESDGLPGLLIDIYGRTAVIQALSAGMDSRSALIANILGDVLPIDTIVLRNDSPLRSLEGLDQDTRVLRGSREPIEISEHGLRYRVDVIGGQKTGMFLDQKDNRFAVRKYLKGRSVLDCFTNVGGFAMNAAAGGALTVTAVDSSAPAIGAARHHFEMNNLGPAELVQDDVFRFLERASASGKTFGGIILDPPAFAKNKRSVGAALKAYRKLNTTAMSLLEPGAMLVSASCSHHVSRDEFLNMLLQSAQRCRRTIRFLDVRGAAADHPVLPAMPETEYLKLAICHLS